MTNLDRALRDFLAAVAKQADKLEQHKTQAARDKASIDIISAITLALNKRSAAKTEPKQAKRPQSSKKTRKRKEEPKGCLTESDRC